MMRAEYLMPGADDVTKLRESLERGAEWTRRDARRQWNWNERRFRRAVADLRDTGYPVVAVSEQGSVYRKARTREELESFIAHELLSRTRKLEEQIKSLREGADRYFGTPQIPLAI